jgi:hypothetical protein
MGPGGGWGEAAAFGAAPCACGAAPTACDAAGDAAGDADSVFTIPAVESEVGDASAIRAVEVADAIADESTAKSNVESASESPTEVAFPYLAVETPWARVDVAYGSAIPLMMLLPSATIKIDLAALDALGDGGEAACGSANGVSAWILIIGDAAAGGAGDGASACALVAGFEAGCGPSTELSPGVLDAVLKAGCVPSADPSPWVMGSEVACAACVGLGASSTVTVVNTVTVDSCAAAADVAAFAAPALFGLGNGNNGRGKRALLRHELVRNANNVCVVGLLLATEGASAPPTISKIRNVERSASFIINYLAGNACVVSCTVGNTQKGPAPRKGT